MPKPTFADIAARAGVGTATVERVLNGRGGVREATAERVIAAARALDWPGRLPERHRGIQRIEIILVRPEADFFIRLARAFRRIGATLDASVQVQVTFLDERRPLAIAARLEDPGVRRSALIIATPDDPRIVAAVDRLRAQGLPVVQIVTQAIPGVAHVGIDNYAAGRVAGMMLSRMATRAGPVAVLCHSQIYQVHRQRVRGFSDYLADHPREGLDLVHVAFGQDDDDLSSERIAGLFKLWPGLAGLYNAGGGNPGVIDALRRAGKRVFFVGHELSDATRAALADGTADVVLDQLPEAQARRAVDLALSGLGLIRETVDNPPIRFTTVTAENI